MAEHTAKPTDDPSGADPLRLVTMVLLVAMILAQVGSSIYLVTYVRDQRTKAECYQAAFDETYSTLATSTGAAGRDRRGLLALLTSLTDPALSTPQRTTALEDYKRQLAASEAERAANPLPNRTC